MPRRELYPVREQRIVELSHSALKMITLLRHTRDKHSENSKKRCVVAGETPYDLAWRMAAELLQGFTACLPHVSPGTNVHWYGYSPECPFPERMFAEAGISMGPSEYGQPHYLGICPEKYYS